MTASRRARVGIGGHNDDRRVAVLRQLAQTHDETYAVTIGKVDIHQNCVILRRFRPRKRLAHRIDEVRGKSHLPKLCAQRERGYRDRLRKAKGALRPFLLRDRWPDWPQ